MPVPPSLPRRDRRSGASGARAHPRARLGAIVLGALVAVLVVAPSASATGLGPIGGIGGIVGPALGPLGAGVGGLAVSGFGEVLKALFSWPAGLINRELLGWLISVPDYEVVPSTGLSAPNSNLAELAGTTTTMAFAALAALGTVAGLRFWLAGLTGSGGFDALEGLVRVIGVGLLIALWPWVFRHSVDLANAAGTGL